MDDTDRLDKVTAFIVSRIDDAPHLLVFKHAGIQLPAGTVEPGEDPTAAAAREAAEETGLSDLKLDRKLAETPEDLDFDERLVLQTTLVYTKPSTSSPSMSELRRGLRVWQQRAHDDFALVEYVERDLEADPPYVSYQITGWVPASTVTDQVIRHFYLFTHSGDTPPQWEHVDEQHTFALFWAPVSDLPDLNSAQRPWLRYLPPHL